MAEHYAIAIDIGTSGIRAQSYNLTTHKTISTAITLRHPLPGANVVDHPVSYTHLTLPTN